MTIESADRAREKGMALVYVGVFLVPLLLCTGLAVDLGRGYLVRANLAKAVDAAALAAARNITAADPSQADSVANNIFYANFPPGFLGVNPSNPDIGKTIGPDGSHIITVASTAIVPTTFMRLAGRDSLRVAATATATRRVVDMAFVIDRSKSLLGSFADVQAAAMQFVSYFDPAADRIALITFSSGTTVADPMSAARGFDPARIDADIAATVANGATATAEALYQAWDQLRSVPYGSQSGLRIVVLFTDGSPNSFPGKFQVMSPVPSGCSSTTPYAGNPVVGTLGTWDFPLVPGNSSTTNHPDDVGLYDTYATGVTCVQPTDKPCGAYHSGFSSNLRTQNPCIPYLPSPPQSYHATHVSSGIPDSFSLWLPGQRPLEQSSNGYPNYWLNANNAARNLAETIANAIRSDTEGLHQIRIYTLGLGDLLLARGGSKLETGASILQRIANDPASPDYNSNQLDGRYFFAGNASELNAAFQAVHDEVVRLSQ